MFYQIIAAADNAAQNSEWHETLKELWTTYGDDIIKIGKGIVFTILTLFFATLISRIAKRLIINPKKEEHKIDLSILKVFYTAVRTVIWLIAAMVILDHFGVNTASIITILGAAGLTIGLAMKDSLSNIASGVMLLVLRPYKTGDFVACGTTSGTVKEMGLFSTILETIDGIFVSVPNNVIFGSPITNYSRNAIRRADITVGIAYGDSLQQGLEVLQKMLEGNELILKDPAPQVLVADLADSSVNLTVRFWSENDKYWDAFWQVKKDLKATIEDAGLNIPFPQRVLTVVNQKDSE